MTMLSNQQPSPLYVLPSGAIFYRGKLIVGSGTLMATIFLSMIQNIGR